MKPGDVLAIRGPGWLSDAIDHLTGNAGASHVGLIVCVEDPPGPVVVEALSHVRVRMLSESIAAAIHAWVITDLTVTDDQRRKIVAKALSMSADPYNYGAIALQLLDAETRSRWFTEHFVQTKYPICSMLDGLALQDAGIVLPPLIHTPGTELHEERSITPNDFIRWVENSPDRFTAETLK